MVSIQDARFIDVISELPVVFAWLAASSFLAVKFFKWE